MTDEQPAAEPTVEPPPPIGGTWKRLYTILVMYLALLVVIFYGFTKAFE